MKKALVLLLSLLMTLTCFSAATLTASAVEAFPAVDDDTCVNGECSLDIEYTENIPTIDGVVEKDEYSVIPNEILHDWYNFCIGSDIGDWTPDELADYLRDEYTLNDMNVYGNWDGKYFYFAVTASAPAGEYTCPPAADSVNLFRYWCLQCGCAAPDAEGDDRFEIGLGAPSDADKLDDCYCFDAWGLRFYKSFKKGTDYMAHWDPAEGVVTYEARFPIKEITGESPREGSRMRFLFLLSQSGQHTQDAADNIQIQCSYGCAQGKFAEQYVMLNFVGAKGDLPVDTSAVEDEEKEQDGFAGKTDFRDPDIAAYLNMVKGMDVAAMQDENGDRYVRLTALGNDCYAGGPKIPISLNADNCKYIAFRYRTSSPDAKWLGLSYQSLAIKEESEEYLVANDVDFICDGQWHTTVIDMNNAPYWTAFITDMLIWPFADTRNDVTGQSIDIMWMKYYTYEPEFPEEEVTAAGATEAEDTLPVEPATDATAAEDVTATEPAGTEAVADTAAGETGTEAAAEGGCASVVCAASVCVAAVVCAAVIGRKKKED